MKLFRPCVSWTAIACFLVSGCAGVQMGQQQGGVGVGPQLASELMKEKTVAPQPRVTKLDVVIPVFDPGVPPATAQKKGYDPDSGIWPELRRAEANRFAYKLKIALEQTGAFGAVRVTPDATASGDLYLLGTIKESNGEEVEFDLKAVDATGKRWFDKNFEHDVDSEFFKSFRNREKDPYEPVFQEAAAYVVKQLQDRSEADRRMLQRVTELRFAASMSDEALGKHLRFDGDRVSLASLPADDDPMLTRIRAIRVRDQLFVDGLQNHYQAFSTKMDQSYRTWQQQSVEESAARRDANWGAIGEAAGGLAAIGLGVLAMIAGSRSKSSGGSSLGTIGAIAGGLGGAYLINKSFQTSAEAKVHRDALAELGESIDLQMGSEVVAFEKETVKLTGDAREQFAQWRAFLARMHALEKTPDKQL